MIPAVSDKKARSSDPTDASWERLSACVCGGGAGAGGGQYRFVVGVAVRFGQAGDSTKVSSG